MSSQFSKSPKLLKGALVAYDSQFPGSVPNTIVFQYNPEQLTRKIDTRASTPDPKNVGAVKEDVLREQGPPVENINLSIVLDATDQLEEPSKHPHVALSGLHPALSALELLLYPKTSQVLLRQDLSEAGSRIVCPPSTPLVLFVWGLHRVVPVKLTSFSVTEEAFDPRLNPTRAKVELGMRVLTYTELKESSIGYYAFMAYQAQKEVLARVNIASSAQEVMGMLPL